MMKKKSTKVNLFYNMVYQITALIAPLITAPYLARVIGATGVGTYSYYHSIAMYFVYFAMLGIGNYGNRSIAKSRDKKEELNQSFSSIYSLQILTSSIMILSYVVFCFFVPNENRVVTLIMILHVASSIFDVSWFYFGLEDFKITSIRQMVVRVATIVLVFMFVKSSVDLWKYTLIMASGYMASNMLLWLFVWRKARFIPDFRSAIKKDLVPCLNLFIPIIATSIYRQMDKIMVGSILNHTEVGYYENSEKLISISMGIISSFSAVYMPRISNLVKNKNESEATRVYDMAMEFAMCIGIAIAFGLASIANEFVPLFFGEEFVPSIILLKWLSISVPFITWACIVRTLHLIPYEKDRIYIQSVVIGAVLNFCCNMILIKMIGVMGAVVATFIAESFVAIYQTIRVRKALHLRKHIVYSTYFVAIGSLMYCVVRLVANRIANPIHNIIVEIACGGLVYIICAMLFLYKTKNEVVIDYMNKMKCKLGK